MAESYLDKYYNTVQLIKEQMGTVVDAAGKENQYDDDRTGAVVTSKSLYAQRRSPYTKTSPKGEKNSNEQLPKLRFSLNRPYLIKLAVEDYYTKWRALLLDFEKNVKTQILHLKDVPWPLVSTIQSAEHYERLAGITGIADLDVDMPTKLSEQELSIFGEFFGAADPISDSVKRDYGYNNYKRFHRKMWGDPGDLSGVLLGRVHPDDSMCAFRICKRVRWYLCEYVRV